MKIMVWNVNGLRAASGKGFAAWFKDRRPDVLGLQEVRAFPEQIDLTWPRGFTANWNPAVRPGYSGTAVVTRLPVVAIETDLGASRFNDEGRLQMVEYERFVFFNTYFPKGSGKDRDNSRVPYKLEFYAAVLERARRWQGKKGVVIAGDFNTAHREIDLANWRTNAKTSGFLAEERAWIDRYLEAGFVDVFRKLHGDAAGHYTWWSQRQGARSRNVGWRIDYFLVSEDLAPAVRRAWLEPDVLGSDHCPLGIELAWTKERGARASRAAAQGGA